MKIYKAKDYDELSRKAASIIASQVLMKPECVLGWQPDPPQSALTSS